MTKWVDCVMGALLTVATEGQLQHILLQLIFSVCTSTKQRFLYELIEHMNPSSLRVDPPLALLGFLSLTKTLLMAVLVTVVEGGESPSALVCTHENMPLLHYITPIRQIFSGDITSQN